MIQPLKLLKILIIIRNNFKIGEVNIFVWKKYVCGIYKNINKVYEKNKS